MNVLKIVCSKCYNIHVKSCGVCLSYFGGFHYRKKYDGVKNM
jgi:hypothetical protein